jgi:peptide/nickel transport system ATP-binding protein
MTISLTADKLRTYYKMSQGIVKAVDGVSVSVQEGEIVGLAGESGCGKSTFLNSIIRVLPQNAFIAGGDLSFRSFDLLNMRRSALRKLRWKEIAVVPQSAMDALDPVMKIDKLFLMVARNVNNRLSGRDVRNRAAELFEMIGIDGKRIQNFPHQFSGGMKQRVIIALSLFFNPKLLLLDEPVTALDVIVQKQILEYIESLQKELSLSILFVTHDVSVLAKVCDRLYIMYAGKIVETGNTRDVLSDPLHPYTIGLKLSFPNLFDTAKKLVSISGAPPTLLTPPGGCRFAPRCPFAEDRCRTETPAMRKKGVDHQVACHIFETISDSQKERAFLEEG